MEEARSWGAEFAGAWLGVGVLAIFIALTAPLWGGARERIPSGDPCAPGSSGPALAEASKAAANGQRTIALRCAYRAFLDAEAAGAGNALLRVGDLLQTLEVERYLKVTPRSAYLRAAEHARAAQDWPVLAAAASRLLALGQREEAAAVLAGPQSKGQGTIPGQGQPIRAGGLPAPLNSESSAPPWTANRLILPDEQADGPSEAREVGAGSEAIAQPLLTR